MTKNSLLNDIVQDFELERIKNLPVTEKFKLYELIRLIYKEAEYANKNGVENLVNSENYTIDPTYNLFAMLVVNLSDFDLIKNIALNYAKNFENSDIYYAKIAITGMGMLMVEKEYSSESIYHFLLSLLGENFLIENLKTDASIKSISVQPFKLETTIKYKAFEGDHRKFKYDILALLKLSHEKGLPYVMDLIDKNFPGSRLQYYLNMLQGNTESVTDYLYNSFNQQELRSGRLIANGAYCIFKGESIISTHYLLNSILGKYSRYDKRQEEINQEILEHVEGLN